jgi:DNA-binding NarL/FixJ family response regulator
LVDAVHAVQVGRRFLSPKIRPVLTEPLPAQSPLARLSAREREVMQLVVEGWSSAEIADHLALSPKTVDTYRSRLMEKLGVEDIPTLVKFAIQHGVTPLE